MKTNLVFFGLILIVRLFTFQNAMAQSDATGKTSSTDSSFHFANILKTSKNANGNWLLFNRIGLPELAYEVAAVSPFHIKHDSKFFRFRINPNDREQKCYEIRKLLTRNYQFLFNFMSQQEYMIDGF